MKRESDVEERWVALSNTDDALCVLEPAVRVNGTSYVTGEHPQRSRRGAGTGPGSGGGGS